MSVKYYLHPSGHDKLTSEMPCAAFLMKMIPDAEPGAKGSKNAPKSILEVMTENADVKFTVASLCCMCDALVH